MKEQQELLFLKNEIDEKIQKLKKKVSSRKKHTSIARILIIATGALVTLSLGLNVPIEYQTCQKNIALALGALLTFVTGYDSAFNLKGLWIRQKTTLLSLYQLKNEINYLSSKNSNPNLDDIFEKYQEIWDQDSSEWLKVVREKIKTTKTGNH